MESVLSKQSSMTPHDNINDGLGTLLRQSEEFTIYKQELNEKVKFDFLKHLSELQNSNGDRQHGQVHLEDEDGLLMDHVNDYKTDPDDSVYESDYQVLNP